MLIVITTGGLISFHNSTPKSFFTFPRYQHFFSKTNVLLVAHMMIGTSLISIYQLLSCVITMASIDGTDVKWSAKFATLFTSSHGTSISEHMLIAFDQLLWFAYCVRGSSPIGFSVNELSQRTTLRPFANCGGLIEVDEVSLWNRLCFALINFFSAFVVMQSQNSQ